MLFLEDRHPLDPLNNKVRSSRKKNKKQKRNTYMNQDINMPFLVQEEKMGSS